SRSDFRKIRERGLPFADKSGFIEEMLDGHPYPATLLLRPTGFGRTVNLTMLRDFLDIRQDSRALFEGLAVSRNTGLCQRWMNRYPVIYLSLKEMRGLTFGEAAAAFRRLVADLCREHDYLESSPRLAGYDKSPLAPLLDPKADSVFMEFGLKHLTSLLREHWGRDAVVLLDDCDAPLACAVRNGYAEAMLSFLRGLAGTTLIGNSALEFGVFAGCLNVLRGSFNDDLYKIRVRGIGDSFLDRCFGFTEAEVADLLARTGLGGCRETIREWCGGHHAGRVPNLYCPRDVMTGIAALRWEPDPVTGRVAADEAGPWAELAEYLSDWGRLERACLHAMETALEPDRGCLAGILERLLAGGTVELGFDPYLAWDRAGGSGDKLLSLLVHCGWLAADGGTEETGCFGRNARAVLPNRMARELLSRAVRVMNIWRLGQLPKAELLDALENGDSKGFTSALEGLLSESILPRDAGEGSPAYLTLLVELFRIFVCPVWVAGGPDARPDDRAGGETGGADLLVKPCRTFNRIRLRVSASPAALKADAREALRSLKLCAGASPGARPGEEEEDFQDEAHARLWGLAFCGRRCLAVTRTL
ncbi:MAG: AAA family ATPase, partial [Desulfovibrionaceae bacterium]|nr:AAA family ATPase [Desulfovibrionaceae bacterium]